MLFPKVVFYHILTFTFQTYINIEPYLMINHKDSGQLPWISDILYFVGVGVVLYVFFQISKTAKMQVSAYALPALKTSDM